jgi:hypothetical protein
METITMSNADVPIETVSDITMGDLKRVTDIFLAIAKAGPLCTVKLACLRALGMEEYFDGSRVKLFGYIDLVDEVEEAVHNSEVANMIEEDDSDCTCGCGGGCKLTPRYVCDFCGERVDELAIQGDGSGICNSCEVI